MTYGHHKSSCSFRLSDFEHIIDTVLLEVICFFFIKCQQLILNSESTIFFKKNFLKSCILKFHGKINSCISIFFLSFLFSIQNIYLAEKLNKIEKHWQIHNSGQVVDDQQYYLIKIGIGFCTLCSILKLFQYVSQLSPTSI